MDKKLSQLLAESKAKFDALSPKEQREHMRQQRESWVRAEMSWPKPKFKFVDGVKIYDSYEDYCNG